VDLSGPSVMSQAKLSRPGALSADWLGVCWFPGRLFFFWRRICVPRGTPARLLACRHKIQRCLTGETICRESSCSIWMRFAGVLLCLFLMAGILLHEKAHSAKTNVRRRWPPIRSDP